MRVPVTTALRAELSRAREKELKGPLALFILDLHDDGDLPAWELAAELAPERLTASPPDCPAVVVGAAPLLELVRTLQRAGERELSAALRASDVASVPVVLLHDVVRMVKALRDVEIEEADYLLHERPIGSA